MHAMSFPLERERTGKGGGRRGKTTRRDASIVDRAEFSLTSIKFDLPRSYARTTGGPTDARSLLLIPTRGNHCDDYTTRISRSSHVHTRVRLFSRTTGTCVYMIAGYEGTTNARAISPSRDSDIDYRQTGRDVS